MATKADHERWAKALVEIFGTMKTTLTPKQFAEVTGHHPTTIYKAIYNGEIAAQQRKKHGAIRIHYHQLAEYCGDETYGLQTF